jgi:hypothetical protein
MELLKRKPNKAKRTTQNANTPHNK